MNTTISKIILAAVTRESSKVLGNVPIFMAEDLEEQEKIALYLGKILEGVVHDMENGVLIVVKH